MKIQEVMTPEPACCSVFETAHQAAIIMRELNVGVVPVVEDTDSNRLIGVVTDRDLCLSVIAAGKQPDDIPLRQCMSTHLITCHQDDDLTTVLKLMQEHQVRRVLVVDDNGAVKGVVSISDIVLGSNTASEEIDETIRDISEPSMQEIQQFAHLAAQENWGTEGGLSQH